MKEQEQVPCSKGVFVHYVPPDTEPETSCSLLSPADVCALVQESVKGGQYTNDASAATHIVVHHEHETTGDVSAVFCSPLWLFASVQAGEWVDPADHSMYRPFGSLSLKGAAAFGMGTITQTGFIGWRRKLVPTLLHCANLSYCRHLIHSDTPQKTCIVIAEDVDTTAAKIVAAKSSNIPVVNLKWLLESLEQWSIQPPQEYSENVPDISLVLKSTNEIKNDTAGMVCDSEDSDGDSSEKGKVVQGGDDEVKLDTNILHKMEGEGKRRRVSVLKKESKPGKEVCEITANVALTSMHADQQKRILERAKERRNVGIIVHPSDENDHGWSSEYSHLVAPQAVTRTQKCLAALAAGIWIVGPKFIDEYGNESKQEESVEQRHEVMYAGSSAVEHGVARHWRLRRQATGHGAFYGLKFAIANVLKDGDAGKRPDRDDLIAIIAAGQGEVVPMSRTMESVDVVIAPSTTKRPSALLKRCIDHGAVCVTPRYVVDWLAMPHTSLDEHVLLSSRRSDAVRALEDGRASLRSNRPTGSSTSVSL